MKNQKKRTDLGCESCPYPSTGFLCSGSDGECMKTRMQKIKNMSTKGAVTAVGYPDEP